MHAIVNWMKQFLILYLILTIFMQLAAADEYKKYIRFLSGIILLMALLAPVLRLAGSGNGKGLEKSYARFWEQIDDFSKDAENMQLKKNSYELQTYEQAVSANMVTQIQEQGVLVSQVRVKLSDDYKLQSVDVCLDAVYTRQHPSAAEQVSAFLKDSYGLDETQIFIY